MSDLIGKELGPYRVLEQIGIGGMATVYKAYHAAMERYVAVKVLLEHISRDADVRRRFKREARVVARLEHPHILPVYDYGEEEGRLYLVMRYIDAGTLKERMAAGPMSLTEISRVLEQVGGALAYAHRLGAMHRDVKPANVLLDAEGNCYLTDFGLARMMEASVQLTATGVGLGTPAYMSPEQGQGDRVDSRSDIYCLGVVLYEMVTGQVPYHAETPMAVVLKHITAPLPLPSEVKPDVHPAVERVILKAMSKNPADRYQTAEEMIAAFDAALRQVEIEAPARAEPVPVEPTIPAPPAEVAPGEPVPAEVAAPPSQGFLARTASGLRRRLPPRWTRAALWGVGGVLLLLAFAFLLSRIPFRVQISGGRVEVVQVGEEGATAEVALAAPATPTPPPLPTTAPAEPIATVRAATPAPAATHTAVPIISTEQARAFAEPILAAIADRPPDFEDDFSDPGSGWPVDSTADGDQWGYEDDAYHLTVTPLYRNDIGDPCLDIGFDLAAQFSDVVMELDGQFISGEAGNWHLRFRDIPPVPGQEGGASYYLSFWHDATFDLHKAYEGGGQDLAQNQAAPSIMPGTETNRLTIVTQGPRIALFVNGEPLWFVYDEASTAGALALGMGVCNQGGDTFRVRFDNFKVWDISDLPLFSVVATPGVGPTPGPVLAYWPFDGDTKDASGNGYDLQQTGENLEFVQSCFGEAMHFNDDPGSYLTRDQDDAAFDFGDRDYSIELWVNFDQVPSQSHEQVLIEKCGVPACGPGWGLTVLGDPPDTLRFVQGIVGDQDSPPLFSQAGQWYHVVVTHEGETVHLYINGVRVIDWGTRHVSGSGDPLILGRRVDEGQLFPLIGTLDEVVIYEGALSVDEVRARFQRAADCALAVVSLPAETDHARAFAEPILAAIADRPPDLEDDFSDPTSGWLVDSTADGDKWGYEDDAYQLTVTPLYRNDIGDPCLDAGFNLATQFSDVVMEIDGQYIAGEEGSWHTGFRDIPSVPGQEGGANYYLNIWPDAAFELYKGNEGGGHFLAQNQTAPSIKPGTGTNRLTIVAQGPRIALFVNGEPLWFVYDEASSAGTLAMGMGVCNQGGDTFRVRFDNLKVWDISQPLLPRPTVTPVPREEPIGAVDTGMGGNLSIRGVVRDSAGDPAPDVYVTLSAYAEGGGWDIGKRGDWRLYTDADGAYSFDNLLRLDNGHYEVWFNGGHEFGKVYENSGYHISENEFSEDTFTLDVTVHPVTGSAFAGFIRYEDLDGSAKDFFAPGIEMAPDHFIALERGKRDGESEYHIGSEYYTIDGNTLRASGLAGGTYYLQFTYRTSDGVLVYCTSPAFEIPPGKTKIFNYTVRNCPPLIGTLPAGEADTGMGGDLSIQGFVKDDSGHAAAGVYVEITAQEGGVYWEQGGSDHRQIGHWDVYTDERGFYAFNNVRKIDGGHYVVYFNGGQQFGRLYEHSMYYIMESDTGGKPYLLVADDADRTQLGYHQTEAGGDVYTLDVTVHPVTGSALSVAIQYQDSDGQTKNYFATPLGPDHMVELNRGTSPEDNEYTIGAGYFETDGDTGFMGGLAGGTYYLILGYIRSDGVRFDRSSPPFEIPPGETTRFEYTIPLNP